MIGLNGATPSRAPVSRQLRIVTTYPGGTGGVYQRQTNITHPSSDMSDILPGESGAHRSVF